MAECNPEVCLKIPFPSKCAEYCIERVLRVARPNEKVEILGMDRSLAGAIFEAYNSGNRINSFDDLRDKLTFEQVASIKSIFANISQEQLNYFVSRMR